MIGFKREHTLGYLLFTLLFCVVGAAAYPTVLGAVVGAVVGLLAAYLIVTLGDIDYTQLEDKPEAPRVEEVQEVVPVPVAKAKRKYTRKEGSIKKSSGTKVKNARYKKSK